MPIYNNQYKRKAIIEQLRKEGRDPFAVKEKQAVFISLCIFPYSWEATFHRLRANKSQITIEDWGVLQGVILGILVLDNKKLRHSHLALEHVTIDFVEFVRQQKDPSPWKFLLNAKRYIHRYLIIHSLAQFGVNWKDAAKYGGAKQLPNPKTFHSFCTNIYLRNVVLATMVFRNYYSPLDEGYVEGVNDFRTCVLETMAKNKKCLPYERFERICLFVNERLPNWSKDVRGKVGYYLSYLLPLHMLVEKQMLDSTAARIKPEDRMV